MPDSVQTYRNGYEREFLDEANRIKISISDLEHNYANDIIIAAVEGGTGYWAVVQNYNWKSADNDPSADVWVQFMEEEDYPNGKWRTLRANDPKWMTALRNAAKHFGKSLHAFMIDHDADYADVAVQLWMFGEVRYG